MPADRLFHKRLGHSQKVSSLTDFEFRVWAQYELSADDFGVMRKSAVAIQADNDNLAKRSATTILRALQRLIDVGLLRTFVHQLHVYVYQHDWQDFQKVTYPARTINPAPPADDLLTCSPLTQHLFTIHPGAKKLLPKNSGSTSEVVLENSEKTPEELLSRGKRLTAMANGSRLMANGSEGGLGETGHGDDLRYDRAFLDFQAAYPAARRKGGYLVQQTFVDAVRLSGGIGVLMTALANHKLSEQWQSTKHIPGMDRWFAEELWRQELPAPDAQAPKSPWAGWKPMERAK